MSTRTTNYNLIKPDKTDFYNIEDFNGNADKVDAALGNKVDKVTGKGLSQNDLTDNLKSRYEAAHGHLANTANPHQTTAAQVGAIPTSQKGTASGVAELDANGKVPSAQLPGFVDDVLEYAGRNNFPGTGEAGKIYVAADTNLTYRWTGSAYVEISQSLALGETSSTAYRGDKGKENAESIASINTALANLLTPETIAAAEEVNLNTNDQSTFAILNAILQVSLGCIPAIGDIELNFSGINPNVKYPGTTWLQRAQGRALVGVGNNGTYNYTSRQEFGSDSVALTVAQIPSHSHGIAANTRSIYTSSGGTGAWFTSSGKSTNSTGGGGAHENRQNSVALYVWERTA